jgi:hypothetical protein
MALKSCVGTLTSSTEIGATCCKKAVLIEELVVGDGVTIPADTLEVF